eukprot:2544570-Alexandrium_andersonii.AAC.1
MAYLAGGAEDSVGVKVPGARDAAVMEMPRQDTQQNLGKAAAIRRQAREALQAGPSDVDPRVDSMR